MSSLVIENENKLSDKIISELKIYFHRYIFNDLDKINLLINSLYNLDPFNVQYDEYNRTISIKIKKTSMKKYNLFNDGNLTILYYNIIDEYIKNFYNMFIINTKFNTNEYLNIINNNTMCLYSLCVINNNYLLIKL